MCSAPEADPVPGTSALGARAATIGALIVVAAFVAGKAARDAILLSHHSVRLLPLFIGGAALLSFPVILITGKLLARHGPGRLIPIANAVSAVMALGEWSFLSSHPGPTSIVVYLHLSITGAVLVSGFWSIINERFDLQAVKKHMPQIGIGATLGGIVGGVIAERTAVYATPETILLVIAVLQLTSAAWLVLIRGPRRREPIVIETAGMWSAFAMISKSSLLRRVAAVVVLGGVAAGIFDYVFKADIVAGASSADLLRSLAIFYTVTNVLTALVQLAIGGALITWLGVPRSAASLPLTIGAFGAIALTVPTAGTVVIARAAEIVIRNSVFRGAYELLYAPLTPEVRRRTKVLIDVGADRVGDIIGAQLVGLIVYMIAAPRTELLVVALIAAGGALAYALRLRSSYAETLEQSLLDRTPDAIIADPALVYETKRWIRLRDEHSFGQNADFPTVSLIRLPRPPAVTKERGDSLIATITDLRSGNIATILRRLADPLAIEAAPHAIDLLAIDAVAGASIAALTALAPRITGTLVDALLDESRELAVRRRLPGVIAAGDPEHAAWGLWRGLADPSFEVRYRCGAMLARQGASGWLDYITEEQVYAAVSRELVVDRATWTSYRLLHDDLAASPPGGTGLEHVFTMLELVLPAESLHIALRALQTDDSALRDTALEYLASVLPRDVEALLFPLIADEPDRIVEQARTDRADSLERANRPLRTPRARPTAPISTGLVAAQVRAKDNA